ncbi:hypothetical protein D9M72_593010 [compost metagenome]
MDRQVGEQAFEFVFAAGDAHRLAQFHGRRNQAIDDGFGHHVGHTHPKQDLLLAWLGPQGGLQFGTYLEHLLGIGQGLAPGLGQFQLPADAAKQLDAIGLLKQGDLPADGLRGQVQLFAGAGDAAGLGHGPEVVQLPIVEHRCFSGFVKTEV